MNNGSDVARHSREYGDFDLIYPVVARRSGGLSLGVNLFSDAKRCSFDCPYCEVLPFKGGAAFEPGRLESQMDRYFQGSGNGPDEPDSGHTPPLRDISVSGNGEPTLSPWLGAALGICSRVRRRYPLARGAELVLITNSTGFLDREVAELLHAWQREAGLKIWAKLDAGTQEWFGRISGSDYDLGRLCGAITEFARDAPMSITIQTMLCSLDGDAPGPVEATAYADRINTMLERGALIGGIDFYTVARPCRSDEAKPLPADGIRAFADTVRQRLAKPLGLQGFDCKGPIALVRADANG